MSNAFSPSPLFQRVEKARRRKHRFTDTHITLAHGSGGRAMHELVEGLFLDYFRNPLLERLEDQAVFDIAANQLTNTDGHESTRLAYTTDSYVVSPIFFPGGDIGKLAITGTVNDLVMSGARPLYLSTGFILEEGFSIDELKRILESMKTAATEANVTVVTGDTKVVQKGGADKIFINTSGIGVIELPLNLSATRAQQGDKVILSGMLGDHGTTIMIARGELDLETDIQSDCAPLHSLVAEMLDEANSSGMLDHLRCLRDPTRGGLATTLNEIALSAEVCIEIREELIPVREEVKGACEILGLDPLYVANEGKLVAIASADVADRLVSQMQQNQYGRDSCIIGEVKSEPGGIVSMRTGFGGTRIVDMLVGEQLPRIC
jgi:hydrogenase expression/formation protein HypE